MVMPRAKEALSGDTKTFESCDASLIVRHSANEYAFDASSTPRSAALNVLGSSVSAAAGVDGLGSVPWPAHAATIDPIATAARVDIRRTVMMPQRLLRRRGGPLAPPRNLYAKPRDHTISSPRRRRVGLTMAAPSLPSNSRGDFPDLTGRAPVARTPGVNPSKSWVMKRPATYTSGAAFIFAHAFRHSPFLARRSS